MTPTRQERRLGVTRPSGWGAAPFRALQRFADEMDRMFDDFGSFCRVVPLPEGAITDQAKAQFRDGVLEITMPAPPAPKGRRLEITEEAKK